MRPDLPYPNGPGASETALRQAMPVVHEARSLIIVEGVSDHIALDTLAIGRGVDLVDRGVAIVPVGGAHAAARLLPTLAKGRRIVALCDEKEASFIEGALQAVGKDPARMFVCREDLEDELIRAVGVEKVLEVLAREGDLGSFETLQHQPPWRGRDVTQQLRRFFGAGARRKLRYAKALVEASLPDRAPPPLVDALEAALGHCP